MKSRAHCSIARSEKKPAQQPSFSLGHGLGLALANAAERGSSAEGPDCEASQWH